MTPQQQPMEWDGFRQRLARLERQNCGLRVMAVAALALAGSLFVMGYTGQGDAGGKGKNVHFAQLNVDQLSVRDANGQMRAWIGIAEGGPRLVFFDSAGQQRLGVGMSAQMEPCLGIFDGGQNSRVVLGMVEGWPGLVFRDPAGKKRMTVQSRDKWSSLTFFDQRELKRTGIGVFEDAAALNLCDDRGKDRVGLTADSSGSSLTFFDGPGKKRAGFGLLQKDEPALGFFDDDGKAQIGLTVFDNKPDLSLYGTNRSEVAISLAAEGPKVLLFGEGRKPLWHAP